MQQKKTERKKYTVLFGIFFVLIWAVCFWRCQYGFASDDEGFYLAIPYRLTQGDALFVHEWNRAQLFSFILYPIMKLYLAIAGETTGIILSFRHIFIFIWGLIGILIFERFRKHSAAGAAAAAISFLLFSRTGIPALSYNTIGIAGMMVSLVLLNTLEYRRKLLYFAAGLVFAMAVLCDPYLLIFYFLFSGCAVIAWFRKGKTQSILPVIWIFFTMGAASLAVIFLAFLFSRASWKEIVDALPVLWKIRTTEKGSLTSQVIEFYYSVLLSGGKYTLAAAIAAIVTAAAVIAAPGTAVIGFAVMCLASGAALYGITLFWAIPDALMFPVNFLGFFCGIYGIRVRSKELGKFFLYFWCPGVLYAVSLFFTSNTGFSAVSAGCTVPAAASLIMAFMAAKEIYGEQKSRSKAVRSVSMVLLIALAGFQLFTQFRSKCEFELWGAGGFKAVSDHFHLSRSETGPMAGIYASGRATDNYESFMEDSRIIHEDKTIEKVLYITSSSWAYLTGNERQATFSSWMTHLHDEPDLPVSYLKSYYAMNPDRMPDAVFVLKTRYVPIPEENLDRVAALFEEEYGYTKEVFLSGNSILYAPERN